MRILLEPALITFVALGVVTTMVLSLETEKLRAATGGSSDGGEVFGANSTFVAFLKPAPVTVILVPPWANPDLMLSPVTISFENSN